MFVLRLLFVMGFVYTVIGPLLITSPNRLKHKTRRLHDLPFYRTEHGESDQTIVFLFIEPKRGESEQTTNHSAEKTENYVGPAIIKKMHMWMLLEERKVWYYIYDFY